MSLHEHLPPEVKREVKQVGWTKGLELAKLPRAKEGQDFDCATWLHKARAIPKENFRQEVEKELTGKESEPWEIIYFKLYKSQVPIVEQAIETAGLMLGKDKVRGYCLEMICADFLAGASLDGPRPEVPQYALDFLSIPDRRATRGIRGDVECLRTMNQSHGKSTPLRLEPENYAKLREQTLQRDSWRCQLCGSMRNLEVHHRQFRSRSGGDKEDNLITLCTNCHSSIHI